MSRLRLSGLIAIAALGAAAPSGAVQHVSKQVINLFAPDDPPCAFFRLVGVSQSDPVSPTSYWFAVPTSHPGFKEIYAMLLAATISGMPVSVTTTGQLACGHPGVVTVYTD